MKVRYTLIAYVDDTVVFKSTYPDTYELQEDGLSKAEVAVENSLDLVA